MHEQPHLVGLHVSMLQRTLYLSYSIFSEDLRSLIRNFMTFPFENPYLKGKYQYKVAGLLDPRRLSPREALLLDAFERHYAQLRKAADALFISVVRNVSYYDTTTAGSMSF